MLRASLEKVLTLDIHQAQLQLKALTRPLVSWATKHGFAISPGVHAGHLIGLRPIQRTPQELLELCERLNSEGIVIAVRCGVLRISPYLDNTVEDVEKLIQALDFHLLQL